MILEIKFKAKINILSKMFIFPNLPYELNEMIHIHRMNHFNKTKNFIENNLIHIRFLIPRIDFSDHKFCTANISPYLYKYNYVSRVYNNLYWNLVVYTVVQHHLGTSFINSTAINMLSQSRYQTIN